MIELKSGLLTRMCASPHFLPQDLLMGPIRPDPCLGWTYPLTWPEILSVRGHFEGPVQKHSTNWRAGVLCAIRVSSHREIHIRHHRNVHGAPCDAEKNILHLYPSKDGCCLAHCLGGVPSTTLSNLCLLISTLSLNDRYYY